MASPPSAPTAVAPDKPRRQLSCLGRTLVAFIDGGSFGAAIGGIIASAQGLSSLAAGTESFVGALRGVASGAMRSGASLAAALAGYSGGVCSLEKGRGKRDGINPFIVGGMMGAVSSVQRVDYHDGRTQSRVFAVNPRAMLTQSISSAALCTLFWYMQQPRTKQKSADGQQQQQPSLTQPLQPSQRQPIPSLAPAVPSATGELMTDGEALGDDQPLVPSLGIGQGLLSDSLLATATTDDSSSSSSAGGMMMQQPQAADDGAAPELTPPPPVVEASIDPPPQDLSEPQQADGQLNDPWASK